MSDEQKAKEANFTALCKELYPKLDVADSVFIEALRKHKDEGMAMEEVANWQPWESKVLDEPPKPQQQQQPPVSNAEMDNFEKQKREFEKFEKANKEKKEKEKKEKAKAEEQRAEQAKIEEKVRLEEQAKLQEKARREEKARLAREEKARLAREEQARLARLEREKAKAEEELKAKIRLEIEQEEKEKRERERKEKREEDKARREKEKREKEKKEKEKREKEKREKEKREKQRNEKLAKEKLEKEEKEKRVREEKEKLEKEEKERCEKEEKERSEKEETERREKEEQQRRQKEEERIRQQVTERFEKEKREKEDKERIEREDKERIEREVKEKIEREEKERIRKVEEERIAKEEKERLEKDEAEKRQKEDKGKEKETNEEHDIGDVIKELADLKDMNVTFVGENAPPRVCIYVGSESDLPAADYQKVKDVFTKKGVPEEDVRILDVASDREVQQFLRASLKKDALVFPIICVDGHPVGSPAELYQMDDAQMDKLLSSTPEDPLFHNNSQTDSDVALGPLNQVLSIAHGVGSFLWLPVTALTWPFRSNTVDANAIKGKNDVEIDVIHTNWYWRSQWRVFRFSDNYVARLHPKHRDVRAVHQYDIVEQVEVTDSKNIVFCYSDNSSPDYLHAKEVDVREMVKIVKSKNVKVVFKNQADE